MPSEWWTYRLSDFLMFSPRLYGRLFESVNAVGWPIALALTALGAWALIESRARMALAVSGLATGASAWLFLHWRYAPINWAVEPFVWAFALLAAVLLGWAARGPVLPAVGQGRWPRIGAGLMAWALIGHPLLGLGVNLLAGKSWTGLPLFGLAPDPTAIYTLGALLRTCGAGALRGVVALVPLAWCLFSALMHLAMGL